MGDSGHLLVVKFMGMKISNFKGGGSKTFKSPEQEQVSCVHACMQAGRQGDPRLGSTTQSMPVPRFSHLISEGV